MIISQELLKYRFQSREQALRVAEYACSSAERFQDLMDCFLSDHARLTQRAAWSVSWAAQKNPAVIQPHIPSLVSQLARQDVHVGLIRNSLRILENLEIPELFHGEVMDTCFDFINKRETPVAIKAFSLTVLFRLSKHYPEIKNELRSIIVQNMDYETPAFESRAKNILAGI